VKIKDSLRLVVAVLTITCARNGNLQVQIYFLKGKQGYTPGKKKKKYKWI
jgi:hypothetical protein